METKKDLREKIVGLEKKNDATRDEWRKYADAMREYLDSAEIKERKEIRKVSKKGKVQWVEYTESGDVITIYGTEYEAKRFKDCDRRSVPYIKYTKDRPDSPSSPLFYGFLREQFWNMWRIV